jgi:hypothetical protein
MDRILSTVRVINPERCQTELNTVDRGDLTAAQLALYGVGVVVWGRGSHQI